MLISLVDSEEKIVGKKTKCCLPSIFFFPTIFSKELCFKVIKSLDHVKKG